MWQQSQRDNACIRIPRRIVQRVKLLLKFNFIHVNYASHSFGRLGRCTVASADIVHLYVGKCCDLRREPYFNALRNVRFVDLLAHILFICYLLCECGDLLISAAAVAVIVRRLCAFNIPPPPHIDSFTNINKFSVVSNFKTVSILEMNTSRPWRGLSWLK